MSAPGQTSRIAALSCGRDHTLALLASGRVLGWGGDGSGRYVAPLPPGVCSAPAAGGAAVELELGRKTLALAAGYGVSLGLDDTGRIAVWGANKAGIGGRVDAIAPARPQAVGGMADVDVRAVAAGEFLFGALDGAGKVYTWGLNGDGALGRPSAQLNAGPGLVRGVPAVRQLALGRGYMLALTRGQRLYAWGNNGAGQLGLGHLASLDAPARAALDQLRFDSVAAGATHSLGVSVHGKVYAWGSNQHGQLGQHSDAVPFAPAPLAVRLPERARAVAAGMHFSLALGVSGTVYAWGWNSHGQLGLGDTADRHAALALPGLARVHAIAAGETHAVAATPEGLFGWGGNANGQLGGQLGAQLGAQLGNPARLQHRPAPFFQTT